MIKTISSALAFGVLILVALFYFSILKVQAYKSPDLPSYVILDNQTSSSTTDVVADSGASYVTKDKDSAVPMAPLNQLLEKSVFSWDQVVGRLVYFRDYRRADGNAFWVIEDDEGQYYAITARACFVRPGICCPNVVVDGDKYYVGDMLKVTLSRHDLTGDNADCGGNRVYSVENLSRQ